MKYGTLINSVSGLPKLLGKFQDRTKAEQSVLTQNKHLWQKDYFELIIFKTQQTQEKASRSYDFVRDIG